MNAAMFWKEYRQHRFIWLAVTILASLLIGTLTALLGPGTGWAEFDDTRLQSNLNGVLLCLAITYGIVVGALLLAGEREERTLVFLDGLVGRRGPIWNNKWTIGVILTLAQSFALAGLSAAFGFGTWKSATLLAIVGLNALAWGLLAGAICRTVLGAILVGIGFMAACWMLIVFIPSTWHSLMVGSAVAAIAFYTSWRRFCRDDFSRETGKRRSHCGTSGANPSSWGVLFRLAFRQSRWAFLGIVMSALVLGCIANLSPILLWPLGTLVLGIACGLAAFTPDQNGGKQFLAAQRVPLGWLWTVKTVCCGTVCGGAIALAWYVATDLIVLILISVTPGTIANAENSLEHAGEANYWIAQWLTGNYWELPGETALLIGIWPLYGFCFGHFFGMLARRSIIAAFLAIVFAVPILAAWVPSLLFGGVPIAWALIIPAILLTTSRLLARPWAASRLLTRRPLLGIAGALALVAIVQGLFFWHRAAEVPDVGEPFDMKAYLATLLPPEKNEAGTQLRRAAASMERQLNAIEREHSIGRPKGPDGQSASAAIYTILGDTLEKGWPERDPTLGRWLDLVFQGEWANDAQRAARLPLGMLVDPRLAEADDRYWKAGWHEMARLFAARALQLQARGDSQGALNHLESAMAISRQIKNHAAWQLFLYGTSSEAAALSAFNLWLRQVGPRKELLLAAQAMLQRHETAKPDPANSFKAQYVIDRNNTRPFVHQKDEELLNIAYQVPWEKERQSRILNAATWGHLRTIAMPAPQGPKRSYSSNRDAGEFLWIAERVGLPAPDGPTTRLSARQWGKLITRTPAAFPSLNSFSASTIAHSQRRLISSQIITALALYRTNHASAPAKLDDLVPTYLAALPINPVDGKPFGYRISKGETIADQSGRPTVVLAPGQAILRSEDDPTFTVPEAIWIK